jgi:hypothetical protein
MPAKGEYMPAILTSDKVIDRLQEAATESLSAYIKDRNNFAKIELPVRPWAWQDEDGIHLNIRMDVPEMTEANARILKDLGHKLENVKKGTFQAVTSDNGGTDVLIQTVAQTMDDLIGGLKGAEGLKINFGL